MNIFKEFGLHEVINASGKMTVLGASTVSDEVAEAMKNALQNFVSIEELIDFSGRVIAEKTGAEDGCPSMGAAAATAISMAAVIAGTNLTRIERLPNSEGLKNEVIIQKGQLIQFGGNIAQMMRLGGALVIEVGAANKVLPEHIEGAISEKTAALFYVKSHHAVQKGMQSLEIMLQIAKKHTLPLIVDAAAEEDLQKYIKMGVDLVIYSGGKALSGPTSGFIAGRKNLIEACKKQYQGIGRAMKVSKESMAGLVVALQTYHQEQNNALWQKSEMEKICSKLSEIEGITSTVVRDSAGRDIYRASIHFDENVLSISAEDVAGKLKKGSPAIYTRDYLLNSGIIEIDPRPLFLGQADTIVKRIQEICKGE